MAIKVDPGCRYSKSHEWIRVTDAPLNLGDIGVWAGAVSEAGAKITFDRLGVWKVK